MGVEGAKADSSDGVILYPRTQNRRQNSLERKAISVPFCSSFSSALREREKDKSARVRIHDQRNKLPEVPNKGREVVLLLQTD